MIISYHGPEKSGKTTFGFTFPKPIIHLDFDLGRDRAIHRFKGEENLIASIPLPEPPGWSIGSGEATRLWAEFCSRYDQALKDPQVKTIFIDTGTQMWKSDTQEYLENHVKRVNPKRTQLQQIEYRMPNDRMRAKVLAARMAGKILVISHYETDEYDERWIEQPDGKMKKESIKTGRKLHAGFGEIRNLTDMHLYLYVDKFTPMAVIETPGYAPLNAVGCRIPNPSYETLMNVVNLLRR